MIYIYEHEGKKYITKNMTRIKSEPIVKIHCFTSSQRLSNYFASLSFDYESTCVDEE